jgi:hypothetical protein
MIILHLQVPLKTPVLHYEGKIGGLFMTLVAVLEEA